MNLQQTLTQWAHNHWSVNPPASYRLYLGRKPVDIGKHFAQNVAEFNMAWALAHGEIESVQDNNFVRFQMQVWKPVMDELVEGYPLREWVCMMQPARLDRWLSRPTVDRSVRKIMRPTVRLAMKLQDKVYA